MVGAFTVVSSSTVLAAFASVPPTARARTESAFFPSLSDQALIRLALAGKASKPLVAQRVAELFGESGDEVPAEIREVIDFVVGLAQEEARLAAALAPEIAGA